MEDDVAFLPLRPKTASGTLKWFTTAKGYGFVIVPGFEEDFFLHVNVLRDFGRTSIREGAEVIFNYNKTDDGFRITEIISVKAGIVNQFTDDFRQPDFVSDDRMPAKVKWYNPEEGYGFVNTFGSFEDIFIGYSVLHRFNLEALEAGEAVCIQIAEMEGRKSVFAIHEWAT